VTPNPAIGSQRLSLTLFEPELDSLMVLLR
jgi:hypothetical protein